MYKSSSLAVALGFAAVLASAPLALADPDQQDHAAGHAPAAEQHGPAARPAQTRAAPQRAQVQPRGGQDQHAFAGDQRGGDQRGGDQRDQRGGPGGGYHHWSSGGHFDGVRVAFSNWQIYHLQPPSDGYEWVQDGDELLLIDIDSGIIVQVYDIPG